MEGICLSQFEMFGYDVQFVPWQFRHRERQVQHWGWHITTGVESGFQIEQNAANIKVIQATTDQVQVKMRRTPHEISPSCVHVFHGFFTVIWGFSTAFSRFFTGHIARYVALRIDHVVKMPHSTNTQVNFIHVLHMNCKCTKLARHECVSGPSLEKIAA